jgi:hypothetical protein
MRSEAPYNQDSKKIPNFYNRTGPGMYDVENNLTMDSRRHKSPGVKFSNDGLPKGPF